MRHKILMVLPVLAFLSMGASGEGCSISDADAVQEAATEQMASEAHAQVGMPGINNFTERRFAKMLLELRDQEVSTYSYFLDMQGKIHFLCNSVGYGLPYSVQFTNPMKREYGPISMPQPEPNGLFMPDGLSATWVMCVGQDKQVHPVYFEPLLIVSPFKLDGVN